MLKPLWSVLLVFVIIALCTLAFALWFKWPQTVQGLGVLLIKGELGQIVSPKAAVVERWLLEEGDEVRATEPLVILQSYDADVFELKAVRDGTIAEIIAYPGSAVQMGDSLALTSAPGQAKRDLELVGFVSSLLGKRLSVGMPAHIWPSISDKSQGALKAHVKKVAKLPMSKSALNSVLKIPELAKYVRKRLEAEPFMVVLSLESDPHHITGYAWQGSGPRFELDSGIISEFSITYGTPSLLKVLLPSLGDR